MRAEAADLRSRISIAARMRKASSSMASAANTSEALLGLMFDVRPHSAWRVTVRASQEICGDAGAMFKASLDLLRC
jgi:hypothetical protein